MPTKKTVLLATDEAKVVQVAQLAESLNKVCKHIQFASLTDPIRVGPAPICNPGTYERIRVQTDLILKRHSCIIIATTDPYDNNYFLESTGAVVIVSFSGWEDLTILPRNNGMVGFVFRILADEMNVAQNRHDENTGCIYDFLWDKSGVDTHLRGGTMCGACSARVKESVKRDPKRRLSLFDCTASQGLDDLLTVLDEVSLASKRDIDVLDRWRTKAGVQEEFDVFLCHNSQDKPSVRKLYKKLIAKGIRPWFDEQHLTPGAAWQDELQAAIPRIRTAAVVVGPNGRGPWQDIELRAFLSEFAKRGCRVIPVILADAPVVPELPIFLKEFTWVDFRKSKPNPLEWLVWGITGRRPG